MERAGYYLVDIHQFNWNVVWGQCAFVTWKKTYTRVSVNVTFNRTVWHTADAWEKKKQNNIKRTKNKIKKIAKQAAKKAKQAEKKTRILENIRKLENMHI